MLLVPSLLAACALDRPPARLGSSQAETIVTLPTTPTTPVVDADGDGYAVGTDCDDLDPGVHPGATEVPADGTDQDCDGLESCYVDADLDGARSASTARSSDLSCSEDGLATAGDPLDCDDSDGAVYPGAFEACNGIDDDCAGGVPDDEIDADGDGVWPCAGDCAPDDGAVYPGAEELECNGVDDDCTPETPDGWDGDDDGASGCIDCDDGNGQVYPGAEEVPGDGVDEDCTGGELCYVDTDGDGFGEAGLVDSPDLDCTSDGEAPNDDDVCLGGDDHLDADADGVPDHCDGCADADGDGVCDEDDTCPGFDDGIDDDGDGVPNGCDDCAVPGDRDGDGAPDDCDPCPDDPEDAPGCGVDSDGDGIPDAVDPSPYDDGGADAKDPPEPPSAGCGCDATSAGSAAGWLLALGLTVARRRR